MFINEQEHFYKAYPVLFCCFPINGILLFSHEEGEQYVYSFLRGKYCKNEE